MPTEVKPPPINRGCPPRPTTHEYRLGRADAYRTIIQKVKRDVRLAQDCRALGEYQTYATGIIEWCEAKLKGFEE